MPLSLEKLSTNFHPLVFIFGIPIVIFIAVFVTCTMIAPEPTKQPVATTISAPDPTAPDGHPHYHIWVVLEKGKHAYAVGACNRPNIAYSRDYCHVYGYRYAMDDYQGAVELYNEFIALDQRDRSPPPPPVTVTKTMK